jgi:hypothetical protein
VRRKGDTQFSAGARKQQSIAAKNLTREEQS